MPEFIYKKCVYVYGFLLCIYTYIYVCMYACIPACSVTSVFSYSETLWNVAHQAALSMGFSRQEYCSGLMCTTPGDLLDAGIKPTSPTLQTDYSPLNHLEIPYVCTLSLYSLYICIYIFILHSLLVHFKFRSSCCTLIHSVAVQPLSRVRPLETAGPQLQCAGPPASRSLPEFAQTHCRWCYLTIASSVAPFSSCTQSSNLHAHQISRHYCIYSKFIFLIG